MNDVPTIYIHTSMVRRGARFMGVELLNTTTTQHKNITKILQKYIKTRTA